MSRGPGRPRRSGRRLAARPQREVDYRHLQNPFTPHELYRPEQIEQIHAAALRVLSEVGVRILSPTARELLLAAGCMLDDDICRYDPDLVEEAVASTPSEFELRGASEATTHTVGGRHVVWAPAGGIPNVSDLDGGKRPGSLADWEIQTKLTEHFDVLHVTSSGPEPQDIAPNVRHLATGAGVLRLTTKVPFIYARGSAQVADGFEMIRLARGLSEKEFESTPHCYSVINTNSPLQLDEPMLDGVVDFAKANQMTVITPFTLAGAMAPVTLAGALVQQHAEFLSALVVAQLVRPGAPVVYGGFTSNVDMKSGSPAFGTPEAARGAFATGQLARRLGIPWRSSMASSSNLVDAQSTYEHGMAMWGSVLGGSNFTIHSAGWIEGGLTGSSEKLIVDVEVLQQIAELMQPVSFDDDELAFDAIAAVGQGGHFFGEAHTMERYETAFYSPLVSDLSNFGQWVERGSLDAAQRATGIWKQVVSEFTAPALAGDRDAALEDFVGRRTREGGASPLS